jgi:TfoX/Sxy family transcriptional regulator of competence genes
MTESSEARFAALADALAGHPNVTHGADGTKKGFGASALKVDGKIFAMLTNGRLVVKLLRNRVDALAAAGEGERLDTGNGRVMKEWLSLRPASGLDWLALAREALEFVGPKR